MVLLQREHIPAMTMRLSHTYLLLELQSGPYAFSVQEAVELAPNPHLERVFGPEVIGRLPRSGHDRVRRTALGLIGKYILCFLE